ncbi:hypothetical protein M422DRAFT_65817 [Sphaerobolus stellatus SS14]|nr:hypothetical protein M422DRAFT_65817 [Sphaerobolus stellatus SS14]
MSFGKLPFEVIRDDILPYLLISSLHDHLVERRSLSLNSPLIAVPLISSDIYKTCQELYVFILGDVNEPMTRIRTEKLFAPVEELWRRVMDPNDTHDITNTDDGILHEDLKEDLKDVKKAKLVKHETLLQIYYCLGLAWLAFRRDILPQIVPSSTVGEANEYLFAHCHGKSTEKPQRKPMITDNYSKSPKTFLPLNCAVELCNTVPPNHEPLIGVVTQYLADIIPTLTSTVFLIKHSRDLQKFILGNYDPPIPTNLQEQWTHWSLDDLENLSARIKTALQPSEEVKSVLNTEGMPVLKITTRVSNRLRSGYQLIPYRVLQFTDFMPTIEKVMKEECIFVSEAITHRAAALFEQWTKLYCKTDSEKQMNIAA